jgi:hypothetical protein
MQASDDAALFNVRAKSGTREQLRQFLVSEGYPLTRGTFDQLCAPARGEGPPIEGYWGQRAIYDFTKGLAWARGRLRHKPYVLHPVVREGAAAHGG